MWRMHCVLALVALYVGLAHSFSWDFVTGSGNQLEFYYDGRHTHSESIKLSYIKLITYDPVGNRMFFVGGDHTNTTIFSYDMTTKKIESLVLSSSNREDILGIAFDPVEELVFWTERYSKKIYWFSLKPGFKNNISGNLLIEIAEKQLTITAITVDSCRGYIYWTMTDYAQLKLPSTIERARFDGSEREVLIGSNLQMPYRLILDHQTQKLYWIDGTSSELTSDDKQFSIENADLNGQNRAILYSENGIHQPMALAVSNDYIYWMHWYQGNVKQLSKNPSIHEQPKEISTMPWYTVLATYYKIDDQIRGIQDCEGLKRLLPNNSATDENVSLTISSDVSLFCVHGKKVSGKSQCQCTHGYTGERCDVSVCQNYCFQGDCIVSDEEQPTCRCNAGFSGERCQVNNCQGYCLNDGTCSLNEESQPVCQCRGNYEGARCDVTTCQNKCFQQVVSMVPISCSHSSISHCTTS